MTSLWCVGLWNAETKECYSKVFDSEAEALEFAAYLQRRGGGCQVYLWEL